MGVWFGLGGQGAAMTDQITPIADELRQADKRMTPNERALGQALLDLAEQNHAAIEMLSALIDSDAELAPLLWPIVDLLFAGGRSAVGVHAALVKSISQPVVH